MCSVGSCACILFTHGKTHCSCTRTCIFVVQVIRSGKTYHERAQLLVQLIYKKSAQQFVHFVETLVASENYADLGRKLLVEGVVVPMAEGEDDSERYGEVKCTCTRFE